MRLKLQFPAYEGIASASATLPYPWEASSIQPVQGLLTRIYGPVMEGGVTLQTAIADVLAISQRVIWYISFRITNLLQLTLSSTTQAGNFIAFFGKKDSTQAFQKKI